MGELLSQLPPQIQTHIKNITSSAGLDDTESSYEQLAQGWLDKLKVFEERTQAEKMVEVDELGKDDAKGGVALTYSGSLVLIGPLDEGNRKTGYYSIGIRKDVPESVSEDASALAKDIKVDHAIEFEKGPVVRTSPIFKIAICQDDITVIEQEEKISEVTVIMTEDFVNINKALVPK